MTALAVFSELSIQSIRLEVSSAENTVRVRAHDSTTRNTIEIDVVAAGDMLLDEDAEWEAALTKAAPKLKGSEDRLSARIAAGESKPLRLEDL